MQVLYFFESIRNPVCDFLMSAVTYLGHEALFLAAAVILFWCIDKRAGYYLIAVGITGIAGSQLLKMIFRIPRPWELDPAFTIVENARAAAGGYSFPSGHSQSAASIGGCLAVRFRDRRVRIPAIAAMILVPISRMYLGVHTLNDVAVGFILALALVFAANLLMKDSRGMKTAFFITCAVCLADLFFVTLYPFPAGTDAERITDAVSNAFKLTGAALGMLHTIYADETRLHFRTDAVWWAQILKAAGGAALLFLIKTVCKAPLNFVFSFLPGYASMLGDVVRYYLIVLAAGVLWPMTFPFFSRLGRKQTDTAM